MYGFPIEFTEENKEDEIVSILFALENIDILNTEPFTSITKDNVLSLYKIKKNNSANYQEEISFIASFFYEIKDQLKTFSVNELISVLSSPKLKLDNEYSLLLFIKEMININKEYSILLLYLKSEYLLLKEIPEFIEIIDLLDPSSIGKLWPMFREHYLYSKPSQTIFENNIRFNPIKINYNESDKWNGLFSYYQKQCNGDIISNGYVKITASSHINGDINKLINSSTDFDSKNIYDQYIQIDLLKGYLNLSAYEIQNPSCWGINLKNWKLEGLTKDNEWVLIDEKENDNSLLYDNTIHTFFVKPNCYCKSFKLTQTGPNHKGNYHIGLARIEFFGLITFYEC